MLGNSLEVEKEGVEEETAVKEEESTATGNWEESTATGNWEGIGRRVGGFKMELTL